MRSILKYTVKVKRVNPLSPNLIASMVEDGVVEAPPLLYPKENSAFFGTNGKLLGYAAMMSRA